MIDFTIETQIERPVAHVFTYATDAATLPTWQTSTVSATPEDDKPLQIGSRLREVHRGGGKEHASLVEVSEYEHNRLFALHIIEGPLPIDARLTFEEVDGGTLLRLRAHGQPTGALRLAQPLLRRTLKRQFTTDCERLKAILEGR
jgi:uncharacterized protein YndB with AHSA1/START domain